MQESSTDLCTYFEDDMYPFVGGLLFLFRSLKVQRITAESRNLQDGNALCVARIMIFRQALVPQIRAFLNVALPKVGIHLRGWFFGLEIHLEI